MTANMSRGGRDLIKTEHREEKVNIFQFPYYSCMITLSGGQCSLECQGWEKKAKERNGIYHSESFLYNYTIYQEAAVSQKIEVEQKQLEITEQLAADTSEKDNKKTLSSTSIERTKPNNLHPSLKTTRLHDQEISTSIINSCNITGPMICTGGSTLIESCHPGKSSKCCFKQLKILQFSFRQPT